MTFVEKFDIHGLEHTVKVKGDKFGNANVSLFNEHGRLVFTNRVTSEELEENYEDYLGRLDEDGLWQMIDDTFVAYIEQAGF